MSGTDMSMLLPHVDVLVPGGTARGRCTTALVLRGGTISTENVRYRVTHGIGEADEEADRREGPMREGERGSDDRRARGGGSAGGDGQ
eukprot:2835739-Rhodomonas_salina.2